MPISTTDSSFLAYCIIELLGAFAYYKTHFWGGKGFEEMGALILYILKLKQLEVRRHLWAYAPKARIYGKTSTNEVEGGYGFACVWFICVSVHVWL